ncbi:MAG: hypothetical protein JWP69_2398 [Flaviaesturariibacter sp.]|nr:hypothetical protein [Flaviaesturariibacter sp.]
MKHATSLTLLCFFISYASFAQKERSTYQPRLFQASLRVGLVNSSLNLDYRLSSKTMASVDFGLGRVHFRSNYYNRFNENYNEYNEYYDNFLNFGREWWCPYTSVQIRRIIDSRSKIKYESMPYANTFAYYGFQLKYNAPELKEWMKNEPTAAFRETYQFMGLFGRQIELTKKGNFLCDLYLGIGGISNYKMTTIEPKWLIGARIGLSLWRHNE